MNPNAVFIAIVSFGLANYALRSGGVFLRASLDFSPGVQSLVERGTVVLLAAVAVSSALFSGTHFAGFALPVGVLAGGLASWFKVPLILSVLLAAITTALLRAAGLR
ncbi:MAG: AzlD domain-containing protein [Renibacterium sp.]|nr:AzlD domain-containing protein [Renibacterium sp.]